MKTKKEIAEWMVNNSSMQNEDQKAEAVKRITKVTRECLDGFVNFIQVGDNQTRDFNFVVHCLSGFMVVGK